MDDALLADRLTMLGVSLENQHDGVVAQVRRGDSLVKPPRCAGAVTQPAVRPAADHIGAVDDEHAHVLTLGDVVCAGLAGTAPAQRPSASAASRSSEARSLSAVVARARGTRSSSVSWVQS